MREQLKQVFASLPPEGIAIHGTNLSRAKRISQEGFLPETHYMLQPPSNVPLKLSLEHAYGFIEESFAYARRACNEYGYELNGTEDDHKPALIVLRPIRAAKLGFYAHPEKEENPIPKENILGILEFPYAVNPFRKALKRIGSILEEHSLISFGEFQLPRKG